MQAETLPCPSKRHNLITCPEHPKDKTPIRYFRKDPNNPHSKLLKTCWFCRQADKPHMRKYANKHKEAANQQNMLVDQGVTKLAYCPCKIHDGASGSKFRRNEVPIENFRMRFGDRSSQLTEHCIDCRNHHAKIQLEWVASQRQAAASEERYLCSCCLVDITNSRISNNDGSISSVCRKCKDYSRKIRKEAQAHYKKIKMDRIKQHGVSCLRCEQLYFAPINPESFIVQEVPTYVRGGVRYCIMNIRSPT